MRSGSSMMMLHTTLDERCIRVVLQHAVLPGIYRSATRLARIVVPSAARGSTRACSGSDASREAARLPDRAHDQGLILGKRTAKPRLARKLST